MSSPIKQIILYTLIFYVLLFSYCAYDKFYVKVIDQYGVPVHDVNVVVGSLTVLLMAVGSETDYLKTDSDGRFRIGGPRVGIELIEKNGYEFAGKYGYGSTSINMSYNRKLHKNSYDNPYYIIAWKRDKPDALVGTGGYIATKLQSSEKYYNAVFLKDNSHFGKMIETKVIDQLDETLIIRYTEDKSQTIKHIAKELHPWELTLTVPQGGLIETDDIFRNLAPEVGYQQSWTIRSADLGGVGSWTKNTFYIKAKNGQIYGQFSIKYRSDMHDFSIGPYWLNFNGSRNLTRPKKYAYCQYQKEFDCSIEEHGP